MCQRRVIEKGRGGGGQGMRGNIRHRKRGKTEEGRRKIRKGKEIFHEKERKGEA